MRLPLLLLAVLAVASAQLSDLSGTYAVNFCSVSGDTSCAAQFFITHDTSSGALQGVYSQFGFISGYVDVLNGTFTGEWFESGVAGPPINSSTNQLNYGTLTLSFVAEGGTNVSATGTAVYADTAAHHFSFVLSTTTAGTAPALSDSWFASPSLNNSLNSAWASSTSSVDTWPVCVTNNNYSVGSYEIGGSNGETGFTIGPCYLQGTLCAFDFVSFADEYNVGIGMMRRVPIPGKPDMLYAVRWVIQATNLDFVSTADWSFGTPESDHWQVSTGLSSGSPFPTGCAKYYDYFGSASALKASILTTLFAALALCFFL